MNFFEMLVVDFVELFVRVLTEFPPFVSLLIVSGSIGLVALPVVLRLKKRSE